MIATFNADAISVDRGLYFAQTYPTIDPFLLTHLFLEASPYMTEASPHMTEASPYITEASPYITEASPYMTEASPFIAETSPYVLNDFTVYIK